MEKHEVAAQILSHPNKIYLSGEDWITTKTGDMVIFRKPCPICGKKHIFNVFNTTIYLGKTARKKHYVFCSESDVELIFLDYEIWK
jgi:hypothetical protein